ncbi:MAG: 50S ribosomal protein L1 [Deltaproteobacteria bacterium]|nr:50S ribosomal protein L1 [Deltaproteobacteria bacterium]NIS78021.1 50S ribosomal protein L1 [Deltaproteobacteria bacterium]
MSRRGKKYLEAAGLVNREERYGIDEAITLLKQMAKAGFSETVDISMKLGVDPKYPDQQVRGSVLLPQGTGKEVRVLVFAKGEKEKEAKDAGADFVGGDDLVNKIKEGWLEFDKAVATPDMMSQVGKIGKILGPRGLMPNPKVGTVTFDVGKAVKELKTGRVEYKVDRTGALHAGIGKISFEPGKIKDNFYAFLESVARAKPQNLKGTYIRSVTLSTTMSPGVKINAAQVLNELKV